MSNPLLQAFQRQPSQTPSMPNLGGMLPMIQQFMQFKNSFTGDPKKQVEELLSSGKMSQEQFNQLSQIAKQFEGVIGGMNPPQQK